MPTVLRNLRTAGDRISEAVARGLVKGGLLLQAKSKEIVPVQTGNLKASCFTRNVGGNGFDADVVVGYTSDYAVFVHEDLTKAHGKAFNVKHAEEIAAAGHLTKKGKWKVDTPMGTAKGGMFPRGENQQAKFLEKPARENRLEILRIVTNEAKNVRQFRS